MKCWAKAPTRPASSTASKACRWTCARCPHESFGAALQYFTGSKEHNVALRSARSRWVHAERIRLVPHRRRSSASRARPKKRSTQALGLAWIPPELRENCGEIELPLEGRLPKLIELTDIRGDLHMHTTETDGRATLEEMAEAARALGYEYIAITDHSKALAMANGLDEKRAVAFAQQVREMDQDGLGIRVFSGLECDIRRDGAMDLAEDALAELDFVIGSVHSYMNLEARGDDGPAAARARMPVICACSGIPPGACCCIASRSRSISTWWLRKRRAATCSWKSTPARSGWT